MSLRISTPGNSILRESLKQFLSLHPTRQSVAEIVGLFHRIASACLGKKAASGSLDPSKFGLPVDDLALDCVAPLFARDSRGTFEECTRYFRNLHVQEATEADCLAMCRRLVFSRVNQELFARYSEIDSSLHKIIRNLKSAIRNSGQFNLDCSRDELWILFSETPDERADLPVAPPEILEAYLSDILARTTNLRAILNATRAYLSEESLYRASYPVTGFALVLRSGFARGGGLSPEPDGLPGQLTSEDVLRFVDAAVRTVRAKQHRQYVGKGKLEESRYEDYFHVVREILGAEYAGTNGEDLSYHDHIRRRFGLITKEDYAANHRTYLEYFTRLTRTVLLASIRKEL